MILKRRNVERVATNAADIVALKRAGFVELEGAGDSPPAETSIDEVVRPERVTDKAISEMTVAELRDYADKRGIPGAKSLAKADLVRLLGE